jgi:hypothetical protein
MTNAYMTAFADCSTQRDATTQRGLPYATYEDRPCNPYVIWT